MLERTRHYQTVGKTDLTPRQREVLALVAAGKTNPEIAEKLGITLDGAKFHVREILAKLEVESREEAAEWWRRERRLGKRVASFFRALAPAGWVKPVAAATAVGGTTLGLVVVGFAMNGGDAALPPCDMEHLRLVAEQDPTAGDTSVFHLQMSANEECRLEGVAWAHVFAPVPDPASPPSSRAAELAASEEVEFSVDVDTVERSVGLLTWSNWCEDLPMGTFLQFEVSSSADIAAGEHNGAVAPVGDLRPPACENAQLPTLLDLSFGDPPAIPACEPLALNWTHTSVLDITRGLRFTWAVETGTKCLLDTTIQVSVTGADGTTVNTRKPAEELHPNVILGVGSNPTVTGVLWNVCGPPQVAAMLTMDSQSWSALDVPAPPCEDPSRPAEFSALWTGTVSSVFPAPAQVTPFAGSDAPTMTYTVKAGDTLASIAHAFGQPVARLIGLNPGLDPTALTVGQEIKIPAAATVTPASAEHLCSLAGCVIAADVLQDVDGWLALAAGRALRPNGPPELYLVDHGVRSTISPEDFRTLAKDNLGSAPRLVAIGDPQKNGILDLVFEGSGGTIVSIAVEPGPAGTYPPTGMTLWEAVPGDGDNAETSFGTATYQRVP